MKVYLVGGAVRDQLLGLPVTERDWVVVGATPEQMITQGFKPVGKDFPVFLHPKTKEEYALARTERKSGRGYQGFVFNSSSDVTLEQDLLRRDMTINAIAQTPEGELIDPYGGLNDIKNRVLRHVSEAFIEDPVRVLRVARFVARFEKFNFSIAPETLALMRQMVINGEVAHLMPERVWQELYKALQEDHPSQFFKVLAACDALRVIFPKLNVALNIDKPNTSAKIRFAVLTHKTEDIKAFCDELRVPKDFKELALMLAKYHLLVDALNLGQAENIIDFLNKVDAYRRKDRFIEFLSACAVIKGDMFYPLRDVLLKAQALTATIPIEPLLSQGLTGLALAKAIEQARVALLKKSGDLRCNPQ